MRLIMKTDPVIQVIDNDYIIVMAWSSVKQKYTECSRKKYNEQDT